MFGEKQVPLSLGETGDIFLSIGGRVKVGNGRKMQLGAIIAAGGAGTRMNMDGSKQLLPLAGKPVVAHSLEMFEAHGAVKEIVIAIAAEDVGFCRQEVVADGGFKKVTGIVPGGDTRGQSVASAMTAMGPAIDTVLVHDGARPLFPVEILDKGLKELEDDVCDGVIYGLPVTDTVKEVGGGIWIERTLDRSRLWAAQTPQIFRREVLKKAYNLPAEVIAEASDDAYLVESVGGRVRITMGSEENIKITTRSDLSVAEDILRRRREKSSPQSEVV